MELHGESKTVGPHLDNQTLILRFTVRQDMVKRNISNLKFSFKFMILAEVDPTSYIIAEKYINILSTINKI